MVPALKISIALLLFSVAPARAQEKPRWSAEVERALSRAGENRAELEKALSKSPGDQRQGMEFLVANMPDSDLRSLKAEFLLENLDLAHKARKQVAWGTKVPDAIFLNNVLPYANVDESRDPWRKEFFDMCLPLVKDCKSAAEAAQLLNSKVFDKVKVKYSTQRKKPQQSPKESMEIGMASCTGLSILLSDACRSVCIPTRIVGTPLWSNKRGNHTWLEIWDGDWHFTGACEPDPKGLDRGWFVGDAAQAKKDVPEHAIYAASFQKTSVSFPLVWAPRKKDVFAENVTDRYAKSPGPGAIDDGLRQIEQAAKEYFEANAESRAKWHFGEKLDQILAKQEEAVRQVVWKALRSAAIHDRLKKDFTANQVRFKEYLSPYVVKNVGEKPEKGWPLFIAMHGGGGAPKEVNDSQWRVMQRYYKDQPSVTGYKYLALRAPNDTWNGFYDLYVPPLIMNLIRQFALFGEIDTSKVYLMGYSHGGYGAFFIGPKIPDRFAAVHVSAAAPTDGTISAKTLRNTRFTFMIGENDNAYGRRERCEKFNAEVQKLKDQNKGEFPVEMEFKKGFGHGGLPDRDKIKEMYPATRNAVPKHLTWELTDAVVADFFWLSAERPEAKQGIDAAISGNSVEIMTHGVGEFDLKLDTRLISFDKPLVISLNGVKSEHKLKPSLLTLCQTMLKRGDPDLACSCRMHLQAEKK
jgi:Transglutaminase-like superfamily